MTFKGWSSQMGFFNFKPKDNKPVISAKPATASSSPAPASQGDLPSMQDEGLNMEMPQFSDSFSGSMDLRPEKEEAPQNEHDPSLLEIASEDLEPEILHAPPAPVSPLSKSAPQAPKPGIPLRPIDSPPLPPKATGQAPSADGMDQFPDLSSSDSFSLDSGQEQSQDEQALEEPTEPLGLDNPPAPEKLDLEGADDIYQGLDDFSLPDSPAQADKGQGTEEAEPSNFNEQTEEAEVPKPDSVDLGEESEENFDFPAPEPRQKAVQTAAPPKPVPIPQRVVPVIKQQMPPPQPRVQRASMLPMDRHTTGQQVHVSEKLISDDLFESALSGLHGGAQVQQDDAPVRHTHIIQAADGKKPLFIDLESFKKILEIFDSFSSEKKLAEDTLYRLNELHKQKDGEFMHWQESLEELERKLVYIDQTLFKV